MIAVDTNVLVHAHREESPKHRAAHACLFALVESSARWGIPVVCIGEFLRVLTHRRVFDPPHSAAEACDALERLLALPGAFVLRPGPDHSELFVQAVRETNVTGVRVFDAQIVALCREHGVSRLVTEDRGFGLFRNLNVERLDGFDPADAGSALRTPPRGG